MAVVGLRYVSDVPAGFNYAMLTWRILSFLVVGYFAIRLLLIRMIAKCLDAPREIQVYSVAVFVLLQTEAVLWYGWSFHHPSCLVSERHWAFSSRYGRHY